MHRARAIVRTVLAKLGRESPIVSDRGRRHGLIVDRFGPVYTVPDDGDSKDSGSGRRTPVS